MEFVGVELSLAVLYVSGEPPRFDFVFSARRKSRARSTPHWFCSFSVWTTSEFVSLSLLSRELVGSQSQLYGLDFARAFFVENWAASSRLKWKHWNFDIHEWIQNLIFLATKFTYL
jgi:hypothetical protein